MLIQLHFRVFSFLVDDHRLVNLFKCPFLHQITCWSLLWCHLKGRLGLSSRPFDLIFGLLFSGHAGCFQNEVFRMKKDLFVQSNHPD